MMFKYAFFLLLSSLVVLASTGCVKTTAAVSGTSLRNESAQDSSAATTADQDPAETEATQEQENKPLNPALKDPKLANKTAPDKFRVKFETTKGDFVVEVTRAWSPLGADRFYNLVDVGFFDDIAIFRAISGFMFQFGIHGQSEISSVWKNANIKDDPRKGISNTRGTISFANAGPNTRSSQMFVNLGDNARLDGMGFTPFGKVVEGMEVVTEINTEYGENSREVQPSFQAEGNKFIRTKYPNIDYIKSATFVEAQE